MFYAVLTNQGTPFQIRETPPTAPGSPLRVTEDATLLAFENQPSRLFASKYATASGKILWHVTEDILHIGDLPPAKIFTSCHAFQVWLSRRE